MMLLPLQVWWRFFTLERQLLVLAFSFKRPKSASGERFFYHRGLNELDSLFLGIGFVALIEMFLLHQLLVTINLGVAWLVLALGEYSLILIRGFIQAYKLRPVVLRDSSLEIQYGLGLRLQVALSNIKSIERISNKAIPESATKAFRGEDALLYLQFFTPCIANKLFSQTQQIQSIVISVADESEFLNGLQNKLLGVVCT
jgi:hypothetical protein